MNQELDRLACDFFKLFARYESSLKKLGFFRSNNGKVIVDWDRFSNEIIGQDFLNSLGDQRQSAEYILENPPKKQIIDQDKIVWDDVPNNDKSVQMLFSHISRMRNNLYHGAKFNGSWLDPQRSMELLSNGLEVLEAFKGRIEIE